MRGGGGGGGKRERERAASTAEQSRVGPEKERAAGKRRRIGRTGGRENPEADPPPVSRCVGPGQTASAAIPQWGGGWGVGGSLAKSGSCHSFGCFGAEVVVALPPPPPPPNPIPPKPVGTVAQMTTVSVARWRRGSRGEGDCGCKFLSHSWRLAFLKLGLLGILATVQPSERNVIWQHWREW